MTVTLVGPARTGTRPVGAVALVRVRPAPSLDPPFDDEPDRLPPLRSGVPDLGVPDLGGLGAEPPVIGPWTAPGPPPGPGPAPGPDAAPGPADRRDGVERRAAAHRTVRGYLDRALEVVDGFRPVGHLRALTDPGQFDDVAGQLSRLRGGRPAPPTRPTSGVVRMGVDRVRLRHLRVCEVRDGVLEAAAVLVRGDRVRALALRLERRSRTWLCTYLQVL
jgi:hypothetical protein